MESNNALNELDARTEHKPEPHHLTDGFVRIVLDGRPAKIFVGKNISEIKAAGNIPQAYELEQIVNGKLVPLADDAVVTLCGGEQFVGHPRCGSVS